MLRRMWKLGLLGALMASTLFAAGCLRSVQVYTIYPDGSGKAEIRLTLLGMMAQAAKMGQQPGAKQPGQESPIDQIKKSIRGKVYWKDLKTEDGPDGTFVMHGTAYFDNIADVEPDNGKIEFTPDGDGFKLVLNQKAKMPGGGIPGMGGDGGEMTPQQKQQAEQMKGMLKGMLAGFEMKIGVHMPGPVTEIEGFREKSGRNASLKIDEAALTKMIDANEKPPEQFSAKCGAAGEGLQAEWDAFKKELAEAKANAQKEDAGEKKPDEPKKKEGDGQF